MKLLAFGLMASVAAMVLGCADPANGPKAAASLPDLTHGSEKDFEASLDQVVSISGRMIHGKLGYCFADLAAHFYVVPTVPAGGYTYPAEWEQLLNRRVRVTGKLYFRAYPQLELKESHPNEMRPAIPPDHYYMVLQDSRIEAAGAP
jgi:hypothetical protein